MQLKNIEFLKQFRDADMRLPRETGQNWNVYFRHYKTGRNQRYPLERIVENRLTQSALIGEIMVKLEREDKVISRRLGELMKKLQRLLAASSCREPYLPRFIARLSGELGRFSELEESYRDKMQWPLLKSLRDVQGAGPYLCSREIRYTRKAVLSYLDDIYHYHDVFAGLLEEAYGRTGASAMITPVEEGLLKLTTLIKSQIFAIEGTVKFLHRWGKETREMEVQGVYN